MRGGISNTLETVLYLLFIIAGKWLDLPTWVLLFPVGLLLLKALGLCWALYQRRKEIDRGELEEAKRLGKPDAAPAEKKPGGVPWGKLWLLVFTAMIFSPLLLTTHYFFFAVILFFGLPALICLIPIWGFLFALDERREEKRKGELDDAKRY